MIDFAEETRKMIAHIIFTADKEYGVVSNTEMSKLSELHKKKYTETAEKIADLVRSRFHELYPDLDSAIAFKAKEEIDRQKRNSFMYTGD